MDNITGVVVRGGGGGVVVVGRVVFVVARVVGFGVVTGGLVVDSGGK